ncbi:antitermination regulator [Mycobacterium sp. 852002-51163_SCH5372311]|uniref:PAS and ANTAR domain-containing protein n=1 Tax=Mycobacterium sp. 852002-51163_SCH5372311 TaxID=1834097 RepID=UPI0007FFFC4E|nr:PAS and ANTAR domain-containing protein [Mycobacterium sp. 852002-51163_SCH5372311]OBF81355.1 antitermination regulator [Mycobacterium sp. 852002-51163_SCH5372311]
MSYEFNGQSADVEQALAGGAPQRVGWFRFYFADQRWEWSEQVQRMHGYEPGSVIPTTELVLAHKHPDDRERVAATIDEILHSNGAFSTRHRIIDTRGNVHHVVVVGDPLYSDRGDDHPANDHHADGDPPIAGTQGFYVDVSSFPEQADEDLVTARLTEIAANRAGIEQAKGMLMLIYGIDDESAFNLLRRLSQETNVRLRPLAEQIAEDFRAAGPGTISRSAFDQLLLTAHLRARR